MSESVREVLQARLESVLDDFGMIEPKSFEVQKRLVRELADEACSALGISEKEQSEPWGDDPEECEQCGTLGQFYTQVLGDRRVLVCQECGLTKEEEGA